MPTPVFVCRLAKDLQNAIRNYAVSQGIAVGDVVSDALANWRGAQAQRQATPMTINRQASPAFSCRIPAALQAETRAIAVSHGLTVTAVVAAAVESFLCFQGGGLDVSPVPHMHQKRSDDLQDFFVLDDLDAA